MLPVVGGVPRSAFSAVQSGTGRVSAADRALMRTRLAAMATPREGDSPSVAALRAILREEALMAHVIANVDNGHR